MIIFTKIKKLNLAIIILFFFLLTILSAEATEITFTGTVIGKDKMLKKHIRVEISGVDITTFTDKEGKFKVKLNKGKYRITFSERLKSMGFDVDVSSDKQKKTFKLKW